MSDPRLPPPPGSDPHVPIPTEPPRPVILVKAILIALLAGAVAAGLGAFVLVVSWGGLYVGARSGWVTEPTMNLVLERGRWVMAFAAAALTIWTGGYWSTSKGSGPRIAVGIAAGIGVGALLAAVGSDLWTIAALGVGWAVAVPAPSIRVAAIRAAPALAVGLATVAVSVEDLTRRVLIGYVGAVVGAVLVVVMITLVEPALARRGA